MAIYPTHIIPHSNYKFIGRDDLLSQSGLVLVRHIDSSEVQKIEGTDLLHPDCIKIQSDHLKDLSNNLLGLFTVEDVFWGIVKECRYTYCGLWEENTEGLMPTNEEYFRDSDRGFYFIPVDNLLQCNLPEVAEHKCHFMIFHTPTKCNFWHVSIRLLDSNNEEISTLELSQKQKKKIWKSAKDFLIEDIILEKIESYTKIPDSLYVK